MEKLFKIEKYINLFAQIIIAYSSFIGVGSALVYYVSEIRSLTITLVHIMVLIYILLLLIPLWLIFIKINRKGEENKNEI